MIPVDDFNTKSSDWYNKDITRDQGRKIEGVTSQNGLHQEINQPTHILNNSSSCIDLIFNSQPNFLIESGVHPSLHQNCHHQIIFAKFNLGIVYPPPYERKNWHYQKANIALVKRAINSFDWEKVFSNIDVDKMVSIFNQTIINIIINVILYLIRRSYSMTDILFGGTSKLNKIVEEKNFFFNCFRRNNNDKQILDRLRDLQTQ